MKEESPTLSDYKLDIIIETMERLMKTLSLQDEPVVRRQQIKPPFKEQLAKGEEVDYLSHHDMYTDYFIFPFEDSLEKKLALCTQQEELAPVVYDRKDKFDESYELGEHLYSLDNEHEEGDEIAEGNS